MEGPREVPLLPLPLARLAPSVGPAHVAEAQARAARLRAWLGPRRLWNLNSTSTGGGVAEMLRPLLSYTRGAGLDARWLVIQGSPAFFHLTKRLHNALHGEPGDGSPLGEAERKLYEQTLLGQLEGLRSLLRPGDFAILHDPQTAGLAPQLAALGAQVLWRCHIGADQANAHTALGWRFLEPYLAQVAVAIFSRQAYVPPGLLRCPVRIITPSIDPDSPKNQPLSPEAVGGILAHVGLVAGGGDGPATFLRADGSEGRVTHCADLVHLGPPPGPEVPLVTQISRWDRLKDPVGVLLGFARLVATRPRLRADLVLAGPNVRAVTDDPDGVAVYAEVLDAWRQLPHRLRQRVHLACLPSRDLEENAAVVNALQRHAAVVVQKSLREGFGLSVTEAMWKARPVVASAVGGLRDQVRPGLDGLLLEDPADPAALASALGRLLADPGLGQRLGQSARERVRQLYLPVRHLLQYADALEAAAAPRAESPLP